MNCCPSRVILLLAIFITLSCALKITRVERTTYLTSNIVRHEDTYSISEKELTNFEVAFDFPDSLSYVEASMITSDGDDDDETKTKLVVSEVRKETNANGERFSVHEVKFPKQGKGSSVKVVVKSYYTHSYTPLPAKIPQNGVQRVVYNGNHYIPSPYVIETQTTTIQASKIEDSTPLSPSNSGNNQVSYGPYVNIPAFSFSSNRVHVVNNSPLLSVPKLTKDVEISHWGNVAVEEKLVIQHEGAELKGTFSRVDYMHGAFGNSAKNFVQILPKGATDVYYRDQIGNISSSNVRVEDDGNVRFEIEPRFVLFGGWKIDFYTGYNLPISSYLTNDGDSYSLTIPFFNVFEDVVVDEIDYRFTLPEGATNIKVSSSSTISKKTESKKFTYLDVTGRPVISFRAKNIISEHKDSVIIVNYSFSSIDIFKEPLLLVAGYFVFFLLTIFFFRFELSISK